MSKPTIAELDDVSLFERHEHVVPYWRDKRTGNLYFRDPSRGVFDRYICVYDTDAGVPVTRRRARGLPEWAKAVLTGAVAFFVKDKLPEPFKEVLLVTLNQEGGAFGVLSALELEKAGDRRGAVAQLLRVLGAERFYRMFRDSWKQDAGEVLKDEVIEKIKEIARREIDKL